MRKARTIYLLVAFALVGVLLYQQKNSVYSLVSSEERKILIEESESDDHALTPSMPVIISDARIQHILYGDKKGGGHKFGVGKPCKSEFPQDWDDEKIISVARKIAANDNLPWKQERNGYYVTEAFEDAVKVRVVKGPQQQRVITAYPVNVERNPCPANDR